MATIGSLAVSISANTSAFEAGLDRATRKAESFGATITRTLTSPIRDVAKLASIPGDVIGGAMKPIAGMLSSIPLVGGAFAALPLTGAGFTAWLKGSLDEVVSIGKEAQRLGVSVEFMSSLGSMGEGAAVGIQHMQRTLAAAAGGSEQAQRAFKNLGLSWKDLLASGNENAFKSIVNEIAKLPDAVQRAARAGEIFGERAVHDAALQNLIAKGPGGIDAMMERGQRTGMQISGGQFEESLKAKGAIAEIEESVKGIGRQFAINLAPYVKLAADAFKNMLQSLGNPKDWVGKFVDALIDGAAFLLDALEKFVEDLGETFGKIKKFVEDPLASSKEELSNVGESVLGFMFPGLGIAKSLLGGKGGAPEGPNNDIEVTDMAGNPLGGTGRYAIPKAKRSLGDTLRDVKKGVRDTLDKATNFVGPIDIWAEAKTQIQAMTDSLKDQLSVYGMAGPQAEIAKKAMAGVPESILAPARKAAEALQDLQKALTLPTQSLSAFDDWSAKMERLTKLWEDGKLTAKQFDEQVKQLNDRAKDSAIAKAAEIYKDTATPLEQLQAKLSDINDAVENGGLDPERAARAKAKAFASIEGSLKLPGSLEAPSLIEKGSAAAYSEEQKFDRLAMQAQDPQERIREAIEALQEQEELQSELQGRMADALDKIAGADGSGLAASDFGL